jgi:hypothetical protein
MAGGRARRDRQSGCAPRDRRNVRGRNAPDLRDDPSLDMAHPAKVATAEVATAKVATAPASMPSASMPCASMS